MRQTYCESESSCCCMFMQRRYVWEYNLIYINE